MPQRLLSWLDVPHAKQAATLVATRALAQALEPLTCAFVELEAPLIGTPKGPLAHLPYAAKDMFSLPDRAPTCGLPRARKDLVKGYSAALKRLDDDGATRLGFTEMTALAYDPSGYNPGRAMPRNPWDREFATGGSSSGSGVAVASGVAAIALGSDTGGSVRIPAYCLGITAWKPTSGLIASDGALPLAPSMDTIGVLARSAKDIALVLPALSGRDPDREPPLFAQLGRVLAFNDLLDQAEPSVRRACSDGLDALEGAGVRLDQRLGRAGIEAADKRAQVMIQAEAAIVHRNRLTDPGLDAGLRQRLARGASVTEEARAAAMRDRRMVLRDFTDAFFALADVIVLPVMSIRTPPTAECDPTNPLFHPRTVYDMTASTRFVNYLGLPAVAVPVGLDNRGLPVGLQFVGRPGSDEALLALAHRLQQKSDWHARLPAGIADIVANATELVG